MIILSQVKRLPKPENLMNEKTMLNFMRGQSSIVSHLLSFSGLAGLSFLQKATRPTLSALAYIASNPRSKILGAVRDAACRAGQISVISQWRELFKILEDSHGRGQPTVFKGNS